MDTSLYNKKILVTGCAGFIGSHISDELLSRGACVTGIDNLTTGSVDNIEKFSSHRNFEFHHGDIRDIVLLSKLINNVEFVIHQAAVASVPESIENPVLYDNINNSGTLGLLNLCSKHKIKKVVIASTSAVYGDCGKSFVNEADACYQLSPYGVSKYASELYARALCKTSMLNVTALRYFNVFGQRQDPNGPYSAVIPKWIAAMINNQDIHIYGDGLQTRDFCHVTNVVNANIAACFSTAQCGFNEYNVATGKVTDLNNLYYKIKKYLEDNGVAYNKLPIYSERRLGDIVHSSCSIDKFKSAFGDQLLNISLDDGLNDTVKWYAENAKKNS